MAVADKETQSQQAADEIMRRVALLELAPGSTFTERELAEQLGMGKVPVREALLRLASNGLLIPRTGSGYTVTPITLRSARDVFDCWRVVEPAALELAVKRGRGAAVAEALRDGSELDADPALREFQFHIGLTLASANGHLVRAHPAFEVVRLLKLAEQLNATEAGCGPKAHDRLLKALLKQDPALPEIARDNIDAVRERILDVFISAESLHGVELAER